MKASPRYLLSVERQCGNVSSSFNSKSLYNMLMLCYLLI